MQEQTGNNPEMEKQVRRRSGHNYLMGIIVGFLMASAILLFVAFFLVKKGMLALGQDVKVPELPKLKEEVQAEPEEQFLDEETMERLNVLARTFEDRSIYDLSDEDMKRGMIDGLVKGTGDRYAKYYTEAEYQDLVQSYNGVFYGIGALVFTNDSGWTEITSIIEDAPASKADLQPGDIIYEVDGVSTEGMELSEVVSLIHGDEGTEVVLTIVRAGAGDYLTVPVIRGEVKDITVSGEMKTDTIGYLRIQTFEDVTPAQFSAKMKELQGAGMQGLVLDLRSNTGGLLDAVVNICGQILPAGPIVSTKDADGQGDVFRSNGYGELHIPIVVLTDGATASASEILTGALKDYDMAVIIGTKTYGKGVVQGFLPLTDGSVLKMTTEQYFTAGGHAIDGVGIEPDIELELDVKAYLDEDHPYDNQLEAAIDYLEEELAEEAAG